MQEPQNLSRFSRSLTNNEMALLLQLVLGQSVRIHEEQFIIEEQPYSRKYLDQILDDFVQQSQEPFSRFLQAGNELRMPLQRYFENL